MADSRTKRQKLEAMARQTSSPNEAAIAKRKLAAMDAAAPARPAPAPRPKAPTCRHGVAEGVRCHACTPAGRTATFSGTSSGTFSWGPLYADDILWASQELNRASQELNRREEQRRADLRAAQARERMRQAGFVFETGAAGPVYETAKREAWRKLMEDLENGTFTREAMRKILEEE